MSSTSSSATPLLSQLQRDRPWCRAQRPEQVERLLRTLIGEGAQRLQFIVDFDHTLSRVHDGDDDTQGRLDTSWGVMDRSDLLPDGYTSQVTALKDKYYPIETDPHLSVEEKIPHMEAWYTQVNRLLQEYRINRRFFQPMVRASNVALRRRAPDLMERLRRAGVPLLILSAGLGDLIVEILTQEDVLNDNVKVVSNFLAFDDEGFVRGIDGDMIHVYNKNESSVHDSEYFKRLQSRKNVVLMGDSLGDLRMADGIQDPGAVLKIGFLNAKEDDPRLKSFLDAYDIVLLDDQTMDVGIELLEEVLKSSDKEEKKNGN